MTIVSQIKKLIKKWEQTQSIIFYLTKVLSFNLVAKIIIACPYEKDYLAECKFLGDQEF